MTTAGMSQSVPRFRLRFLLHEVDLIGPEVVLGRSPDCHITIEDPLVSREHARIRFEADSAYLCDLGSRNGLQVNGRAVHGEVSLQDGDRIRIGTQELVFSRVSSAQRQTRATGCIVVCTVCAIPYPEEASHCPHCGALRRDDETMTGVIVESEGGWTLQLMLEGITRALEGARPLDAVRMMERLASHVERELDAGRMLQEGAVAQISAAALGLCAVHPEQTWLEWVLELHMRCGHLPTDDIVAKLEQMGADQPRVQQVVDNFLVWWEGRGASLRHGDAERWARLRKLGSEATRKVS